MKKVLKSKRATIGCKKASLQSELRRSNQWQVTEQGQHYQIHWDGRPYHLSLPAIPNRSRSASPQKKKQPISTALWFNEVGGWIIVLVLGAYIIDDVFHLRGNFLTAVWLLICLPILIGSAKWINGRRSQLR